MEKLNCFFRNSGKGKIAGIIQVHEHLPINMESLRGYVCTLYWKYLKEYCGYDEVYIVTNSFFTKKKSTCSLKNYPLIYNINQSGILKDIDDLFIQGEAPNFWGGILTPSTIFNLQRIQEWCREKWNGMNFYYISDDPFFPNTNIIKEIDYRFKNGKLNIGNQKRFPYEDQKKEFFKIDIPYLINVFDNLVIAFTGYDYPTYLEKTKIKNIPSTQYWTQFETLTYSGVNIDIKEKLSSFSWESKKYDCEYHGILRPSDRVKKTIKYYSALKNKFLLGTKAPKYFHKIPQEKYDLIDKYIPNNVLNTFIGQNAKCTFVTHYPELLGNQTTPRYFETMIGDVVPFLDIEYDPFKKLTSIKELQDFMYVSSPEEFSKKVSLISNDKILYQKIKRLQRQSIYEKFYEFIEPENRIEFEKII